MHMIGISRSSENVLRIEVIVGTSSYKRRRKQITPHRHG